MCMRMRCLSVPKCYNVWTFESVYACVYMSCPRFSYIQMVSANTQIIWFKPNRSYSHWTDHIKNFMSAPIIIIKTRLFKEKVLEEKQLFVIRQTPDCGKRVFVTSRETPTFKPIFAGVVAWKSGVCLNWAIKISRRPAGRRSSTLVWNKKRSVNACTVNSFREKDFLSGTHVCRYVWNAQSQQCASVRLWIEENNVYARTICTYMHGTIGSTTNTAAHIHIIFRSEHWRHESRTLIKTYINNMYASYCLFLCCAFVCTHTHSCLFRFRYFSV